MQTYQEYQFFIQRYKDIVYAKTAENLYSYVVYPLCRPKRGKPQTRGPQDNYKDYDRTDISRFKVDEVLAENKHEHIVVPDGPYKISKRHVFKPESDNPVIETIKEGPSQYENFIDIISRVTDTQFPRLIEQYASRDNYFKYTSDCAEELILKLKTLWRLV